MEKSIKTNPATFGYIESLMDIFQNTSATRWVNSPEVSAWCEESRKEIEEEQANAK